MLYLQCDVVSNVQCYDPLEKLCYTLGKELICYYCAAVNGLENTDIVIICNALNTWKDLKVQKRK